MRKRYLQWIWGVAAALVLCLFGACAGQPQQEEALYIEIKGLQFSPNAATLDLRGVSLSPAEADALRLAYPDKEILWRVPIGEELFDSDVTELALPSASEAELKMLRYLPKLQHLDARGSDSHEALFAFADANPEITLLWDVALRSIRVPGDAETLDVSDASLVQVEAVLPMLKELKTVSMRDFGLSLAQMRRLEASYSSLAFEWAVVPLFGEAISPGLTELDFTDKALADTVELAEALPFLPAVERVYMLNTGLDNEQLVTLCDLFPGILFVWEVQLKHHVIRTDTIAFSTLNPTKYQKVKNADGSSSFAQRSWPRLTDEDTWVFRYCRELIALDVGHNYISDLSFLEPLTKLQALIVADNKIEDISPIANLTELIYLELFMNRISDLTPLLGLTKLKDLNISEMQVAPDLSPLYQMTGLERLWYTLSRNTREEERALAAALPDCKCNYTAKHSTGDGWRTHERYFWMRLFFGKKD